MLFGSTPHERAIEREMTRVPGFKPRGYGIHVFEKYEYTAKDCDCRYCAHYSAPEKDARQMRVPAPRNASVLVCSPTARYSVR